jgi:transcriptional regulator with XRE-family HTH domain
VTDDDPTLHELVVEMIKAGMARQGMTQGQLAEYSGFTQSHISRMLGGKRGRRELEAWQRLRDVLDHGKRFCPAHGTDITGRRCLECYQGTLCPHGVPLSRVCTDCRADLRR